MLLLKLALSSFGSFRCFRWPGFGGFFIFFLRCFLLFPFRSFLAFLLQPFLFPFFPLCKSVFKLSERFGNITSIQDGNALLLRQAKQLHPGFLAQSSGEKCALLRRQRFQLRYGVHDDCFQTARMQAPYGTWRSVSR